MSVREDQLEQLGMQSPIEDADIDRALTAVREKLQVIEARLEQLEQAAVVARKEERLLESLIALRRGQDTDVSSPATALQAPPAGNGEVRADVVDATIALLRAEHRPMHISELMTELVRQQVRIPGSGQQANLISYLRRDHRIVRPSRGIYGLAEWGLKDAPASTRRKKRSKRRKTTRSRKATS